MKKLILTAALVAMAFPAYAADEVVVSERGPQTYQTNGYIQPILGERIATQVLDVATQSAAFNAATSMVRICNNAGAALWYLIGDNPSAVANTDGNEYLPSGQCVDEPVEAGEKIDTAADA